MPLSSELADSVQAYREIVLFRFVKDLPVFISSAVTITMLFKLIKDCANGKINTLLNRKRIILIIIVLAVSSLLFNVLGVIEVNMLNQSFSGIYGGAVYTIGIRSDCEPIVYAMALWFGGAFMQCIPEKD